MIRRSTLVLLTCLTTLGASAGATLSTTQSAFANDNRKNDVQTAEPMLIAQASGGAASGLGGGLDIDSRGEAVKALQLRLRAGEYYSGPVDGIYGLATERAVRSFQADADIAETGTLNDETWQKLQLATGDLVSETIADAEPTRLGEEAAVAQAENRPVPETAPTASELPAEGESAEIIVTDKEGGIGRIFGLSVGLIAVLASFGIGFFLANKDKESAAEEGEWGVNEPATNPPASGTAAEATLSPGVIGGATPTNNAYTSSGSSGQGIAPLSAPANANGHLPPQMAAGQMAAGQMGGTSPLTQVDIVDGLIGDLRNPDPARRRKAIWELGQRGNSVAMKPLVDAMTDADSKEKSLVLAALSEIGIRSLKPMSKALAIALQDDNPEVRKNAIRDLTRVYDLVVQISQMLGHATEDEDPEVRQTASWALEQLSRIRRTQDIDANVRSFTGAPNPTPPIDLLSSEASLRRSSQ